MKFEWPKKENTAGRRRRRRISDWTARQRLRAAARVGDAAVTTAGDIVLAVLKILISAVLVLITAGLLFACIFAYYVKNSLTTDLNISLSDYSLSLSSTIWAYDDSGSPVELAVLQTDENRIWIDYEDIPKYFEEATVAIEDKRFYDHKGVDWYRTAGAFVNMFLGMKNDFGGSTITQQLLKNVTGKDEVTVQRKLVEIFQALDLEKTYIKSEIVEWYLNVVYFGEGAYGVAQAAQTYFGRDVDDLSLAQCASIIGITNNPSKYSPFISVDNNKSRTKTILYEMYDQGYISRDEYNEAVSEVENNELHFTRGENEIYQQEIYTYYVETVIRDVLHDMQTKLGLSEEAARQLLYYGGYQVYACIDTNVQAIVDAIYADTASLPQAYIKSSQILESACVVLDPYTGEIKALIGGVGEKNRNFGWNYATDAHRPAGSSIKPLASYGPAMDLGLITESTLVNDSPYIKLNGTYWYPRNSGGYDGIITIWDALVRSKNTVAAQIIDKLTPSVSFEYLVDRMGFDLVEADRDYAPLALGQFTNGVTVREMAQAYTAFPNDGWMNFARSYSLVTDSNGVTILDNGVKSNYVFSTDSARCLTEMLEAAAWYGTGYEAYLGYGKMPVAGKTGTTSDDYDRWFCGFSPYYVCAIWTGYDQPEAMYFSGNPAAKIWRRVMEQINAGLPVVQFSDPANRGYDTGIFGNLQVTPTPTAVPTPTPSPTPPPTPEPTDTPEPIPIGIGDGTDVVDMPGITVVIPIGSPEEP
ncbi:MAG: transglycosylase domain-containing protein [Oscillospiraceae bacterium]|nr:transglycosylase domain-containing protein [Oscillospiraceae bacterium]